MAQPRTVLDNIHAIIALEQERERRRSLTDKIVDGIASFSGRVTFVLLHLLWFSVWASINLGLVKFGKPFDPYPFQLLCMLVSMEGVLLATFVLIKQNRMSHRADHRAHLTLQISLLTEQEATKAIQMLERIAAHLGMEDASDSETRELSEATAVADLARELEQKLPEQA